MTMITPSHKRNSILSSQEGSWMILRGVLKLINSNISITLKRLSKMFINISQMSKRLNRMSMFRLFPCMWGFLSTLSNHMGNSSSLKFMASSSRIQCKIKIMAKLQHIIQQWLWIWMPQINHIHNHNIINFKHNLNKTNKISNNHMVKAIWILLKTISSLQTNINSLHKWGSKTLIILSKTMRGIFNKVKGWYNHNNNSGILQMHNIIKININATWTIISKIFLGNKFCRTSMECNPNSNITKVLMEETSVIIKIITKQTSKNETINSI